MSSLLTTTTARRLTSVARAARTADDHIIVQVPHTVWRSNAKPVVVSIGHVEVSRLRVSLPPSSSSFVLQFRSATCRRAAVGLPSPSSSPSSWVLLFGVAPLPLEKWASQRRADASRVCIPPPSSCSLLLRLVAPRNRGVVAPCRHTWSTWSRTTTARDGTERATTTVWCDERRRRATTTTRARGARRTRDTHRNTRRRAAAAGALSSCDRSRVPALTRACLWLVACGCLC